MESFDTKVFIGGLPPQTTQESLASYLSQYGQITECKVVMDKTTGRSKGYGFVVYSTPLEAQSAVAEGYLTVDGKRCNCNLGSVGAKKDTNTNKKRSFSGAGIETSFAGYGDAYPESYYAYSMTPVGGVTPGMDFAQDFQNFQMHMNSSLSAMYTDIQSIHYEMTMMSQNLNSLKATIMAMKAGVDGLCASQ